AELLDRARERGLEPRDVAAAADGAARDDWAAAASFFAEYVDVLGSRGEMDYADLVRRALVLLDDPDVLAEVRARYRAVFVDEFQDTDPAQARLLALLTGPGGDLVVVGDPDQSIYGFRGADVAGILGFPDRFPRRDGTPAPVLTLRTSRRFGAAILAASRSVAARIPAPGLPVARLREHRELRSGAADEGSVELRLFASAGDELAAVADILRRAHLEDGVPYAQMAVLVRSGVRSIPVARRALVAAGVPVATVTDDVPIARDPAVAPLLLVLRGAVEPSALTSEAVRTLLVSPLVGATPAQLRRLGRELRRLDADAGEAAGRRIARPSAELVARAIAEPADLVLVEEASARPAVRLVELLGAARAVLAAGDGAEQALWQVWERSGLARRWAAASADGGDDGRAADRDLDAAVALFEAVARLEERRPRAGVATLLDELQAQEIPGRSRADGVAGAPEAVRLMTAHRSKGLEWQLVVVAGVQEDVWPDLRRRSSLLEGDRLDVSGPTPPATAGSLLADERRLFYVALTRARHRVVVTAVASPADDGERPSRFLDELGVPLPEQPESVDDVLSLGALVGRLRRAVADPGLAEGARSFAAAQLARLAAPGPDGRPLVAAAHPDNWWGVAELTPGARGVFDSGPVRLSGSSVSSYDECPLRWFLDHEAHAVSASTVAQSFGNVVHELAHRVATGQLPPDEAALGERLDEVWPALGFDAEWQRTRERREAEAALRRFLAWFADHRPRWVASEAPFAVDYAGALLRGSIDWVERDDDGAVVVVDFKTGRAAPTDADVVTHAQLGVYQIAVRDGGLRDVVGLDATLGGASLAHLRITTRGALKEQRQQPLDPAEPWADQLVAGARDGMLAELFPARPSSRCRVCAFARACPTQDAGGQVVR
ncbi:MAG: hypothetical protein QOH44_1002, partial [Actinomycetota bacterium]|nr:hypothetical protein [Actinomycetota bacterium]